MSAVVAVLALGAAGCGGSGTTESRSTAANASSSVCEPKAVPNRGSIPAELIPRGAVITTAGRGRGYTVLFMSEPLDQSLLLLKAAAAEAGHSILFEDNEGFEAELTVELERGRGTFKLLPDRACLDATRILYR